MKQIWKDKWLMLLGGVIFLAGLSGRENRTEEAMLPPADDEEVTVPMVFGFAEDSNDNDPRRFAVEGSKTAFEAKWLPKAVTHALTSVPDQLHNLEIYQYDGQTEARLGGGVHGGIRTGQRLDVTLTPTNGCRLLLVARGDRNIIATLSNNKFLSDVQVVEVGMLVTNVIGPSNSEDMKKTSYVFHLEHANVAQLGGKCVIQSSDGNYDTRLLLKRPAVRLTMSWNYDMSGYTLKQLLLQDVPLNYAVIPAPDSEGNYPSILDQFTILQIKNVVQNGGYSCWIPANTCGERPAADSETQRTKENVPKGNSFSNFVTVGGQGVEVKLDYRIYIDRGQSTNFDIKSGANYDYAVNSIHSGTPTSDKRMTYINPVPASENNENFVPTANCFMVFIRGGFRFDPLAHQQNGDPGRTSGVLEGWCEVFEGITTIELLQQIKEDGDIGGSVVGIVTSEGGHTNIVDLKRTNGAGPTLYPVKNKGGARVYYRVVPGTTGGSGVIAAYDTDGKIPQNWHVWVTDYRPDATGDADMQKLLTKRELKFTYGNHGNQLPMVDYNLGAMAGYTGVSPPGVKKFKIHRFHYQWERKDPYLSGYSNKPITIVSLPIPTTKPTMGILSLYKPDRVTFLSPDSAVDAQATYRTTYRSPLNIYKKTNVHKWIADSDRSNTYLNVWNIQKTVHDPCPAGWYVALIENYLPLLNNVNRIVKVSDNGANVMNSDSVDAHGGMVVTYDTSKKLATYV